LHRHDVAILRALSDISLPLLQSEIEARVELCRRTIGPRLKSLRAAGLIHRPFGERGGDTITEMGRGKIARYLPTNCPQGSV
jgi:DNA-binding HxlR family transcriptional regulator